MPNYTQNYNLVKPLPTDLYDIDIYNQNMDIIDQHLNKNEYSTDEVDTGMKWIDGKTVYRKVVQIPEVAKGSTSTSSDNPTAIICAGIDTLIDARGILERKGTKERYTIPEWTSTAKDTYNLHVHFDLNNGGIIVRTGTDLDLSGGHIIALYTKV